MKQESLEEAANRLFYTVGNEGIASIDSFMKGANYQAERMYSEEDMRKAYDQGIDDSFDIGFSSKDDTNFNVFIEQFKKQLMNAIKVIELRAQYEVLSHIEEMFVPKSKHKVAKYVDKKMREILKELEIKNFKSE